MACLRTLCIHFCERKSLTKIALAKIALAKIALAKIATLTMCR